MKHFGKTDSEKLAEEIQTCRHIVREIVNFGVSQRQILRIINFLALELENREQLEQLSDLSDMFIGDATLARDEEDKGN